MDRAFLRLFNKRIYITPLDLVTKEQLLIDSLTCIEHELTESDYKEIVTKLGRFLVRIFVLSVAKLCSGLLENYRLWKIGNGMRKPRNGTLFRL